MVIAATLMAIVVALSGNTEFFVLLYGVIAHLLKVKLILLVVFKHRSCIVLFILIFRTFIRIFCEF